MPFRTLTLPQAAQRLHLDVPVVAQLVKRGEVPCTFRGEEPVFSRRELDAWASQRLLGMTSRNVDIHHRASSRSQTRLSPDEPLVPRLFCTDWIAPRLLSKTKPSVLRDMVALAATTNLLYDDAALLHGLEERELLCSTAIGDGVAFLHMRYHDANLCGGSFVVLGRTARPIFASAVDGQATDIFFLLCCQDDALHLHVLARLCAMAHGTPLLTELRQAETRAEMLAAVERSEKALLQAV